MGWIIESIAKIMLSVLDYMMVWTASLVSNLRLDVGMPDNYTPFQFIDPATAGKFGLLGKTFPLAGSFGYWFLVMATLFVFIIMIWKLYQSFFSPFTDTEHPIGIASRSILAIFGVMYSYSIFVTFESLFNTIFNEFMALFTGVVDKADFSQFNKVASGSNMTAGGTHSLLEYSQGQTNNNSFEHVSQLWGNADLIDPSGSANISGINNAGNGLGLLIIEIIIASVLITSFIKLVLEIYQRYVTLGLIFYTCPLAFAMVSSRSTKQILSSWFQMFLSQFVLMCMNLFFVGSFIGAFVEILTKDSGQKYYFSSDVDFVTTMLLLIAWLIVGQKVDEYMRSLNLSIANTGSGLGHELAGSAMATYGSIKGVMRSGGKAITGSAKFAAGNLMSSSGDLGGLAEESRFSKFGDEKAKLTDADIGDLSGDELRNGLINSDNALLDGDGVNAQNVDWDKSAEASGLGGTVLKDSEGNILGENALANSAVGEELSSSEYLTRQDGDYITPVTEGAYKKMQDEANYLGTMGRLPGADGIGYDPFRYTDWEHVEGSPNLMHFNNSKTGDYRDFDLHKHKNLSGQTPAPKGIVSDIQANIRKKK